MKETLLATSRPWLQHRDNPLLADLEEEKHEDSLIRGNLAKRENPDLIRSHWTSQGYVARIIKQTCSCGSKLTLLQGVFHRESNPLGDTREQRLDDSRFQVSLEGKHPIETSNTCVKLCAYCLITKGFHV